MTANSRGPAAGLPHEPSRHLERALWAAKLEAFRGSRAAHFGLDAEAAAMRGDLLRTGGDDGLLWFAVPRRFICSAGIARCPGNESHGSIWSAAEGTGVSLSCNQGIFGADFWGSKRIQYR